MIDSNTAKARKKAAILSLSCGFLMLLLKVGAYLYTGSYAIYSDAMESIVHIAAMIFMVFSIWYSMIPPDKDHPYGHGKVSHFAIAFEGGMIFIAGISIIWEASRGIFSDHQIENLDIGLYALIVSGIINLILGRYLIHCGKTYNSPILIADGKHILSDSITSFGIIVGVCLVWLTNINILDSITAIIVALHLLWTGGHLVDKAIASLMDRIDPEILEKITISLNSIREDDWLDIHNLRVLRNGDFINIEFHMVVPPEWNISHAHSVSNKIERKILLDLKSPGSVIIHLDPKLDDTLNQLVQSSKYNLKQKFTTAHITRIVND